MLKLVIGLLLCFLLQANCEVCTAACNVYNNICSYQYILLLFAFQIQRTSATQKMYVPFYKLYTPQVILSTAEFTTAYYNYSRTAITFDTGSPSYKRLFKIPLIPGGVLTRYANIVVRITTGLQKAIRSGDSDPKFLISDGEAGIGFEMREEASIHCRSIQGSMGAVLGSRVTGGGASYSASTLPEEFIITLAPSERWGSCYSALASGLISPTTYTRSINLDQGLWLEVYAEGTNERYLFNYIIVEIHEN